MRQEGPDMTQNEAIKLAIKANLIMFDYDHPSLGAFATLVAEHEREACIKAIEDQIGWDMDDPESTAIKAIQARGQA
jgi:hypothetical protein